METGPSRSSVHVTDETYGLFRRIVRNDPRTFLYQSSEQYLRQGGMTSKEETNDDSSEGEAGFSLRRYLVLRLLDDRFGEVREEVGVWLWCRFVEHHRRGRRGSLRKLLDQDLVDVIGLDQH